MTHEVYKTQFTHLNNHQVSSARCTSTTKQIRKKNQLREKF
jgi:hypothetical protein